MKVFKYVINAAPNSDQPFIVRVPKTAVPLHVGLDPAGAACVWIMVDPEATVEDRQLWVYGTGHPIPPEYHLEYFGTIKQDPFMWHVFFRS